MKESRSYGDLFFFCTKVDTVSITWYYTVVDTVSTTPKGEYDYV